MDLHVLKCPESENYMSIAWSVCVYLCFYHNSKTDYNRKSKFSVHSLKINELIQSSEAGVYFFFSTQLMLKIPMFDLNVSFIFYRTSVINIQWIFEFLQFM